MPEMVVDGLKVVHVEDEDPEEPARHLFDGVVDPLAEEVARRQPGKGVVQPFAADVDDVEHILFRDAVGGIDASVQLFDLPQDVVHRPEFLRNGGTPVAIEHHEQQGVQQRLCEKGQQHVLDRRQDFDPVDESPACFGYVHERREVERIPKNADERPRLIAFEVAEEGFPAAAVEEPFARDVIPDVRKAHCGIGMRDEGTGAAEHQVVAVSRMVAAGNAFTEQGNGAW